MVGWYSSRRWAVISSDLVLFSDQVDSLVFGTRTVMWEMNWPVNRLPAVFRMRRIELKRIVVFGIARG